MMAYYTKPTKPTTVDCVIYNRVSGGFSPPLPTPPRVRVRTGRFTAGWINIKCENVLLHLQGWRASSAPFRHPLSGVNAESSVTLLLLDRDVRPFTMSRQLNRAFGYYGLCWLLPNLSERVTLLAAMSESNSNIAWLSRSPRIRTWTVAAQPHHLPYPLNPGLRYHVPTYPRTRPSMMFLFVGSLLCYRLPLHKASRLCSCLLLIVAVL